MGHTRRDKSEYKFNCFSYERSERSLLSMSPIFQCSSKSLLPAKSGGARTNSNATATAARTKDRGSPSRLIHSPR